MNNDGPKAVFCFTYAGGTSAFFDKLEECMPPEIRLVKLEYAGHGNRHREDFYDSFTDLTTDLYDEVRKVLFDAKEEGIPLAYSLFGYSMGSIAAVEMLKKIMTEREFDLPEHIFLAAHEPFTKAELLEYDPEECDEYVKKRTLQFGSIPPVLNENDIFWRMYLPIYRADYTLIAKYDFEKLDIHSEIPATVFYSETDTRYEDMRQWTRYFVGQCSFVQYEGTHFFINEHYADMAKTIEKRLGLS